jgi:hypothetical protein
MSGSSPTGGLRRWPGKGFTRGPRIWRWKWSPRGEEAEAVLAKVLDYLGAGARAVWLVYPELQAVEVYGRGGEGRLLRPGEVLEGGEALPGFRLPLKALFGA